MSVYIPNEQGELSLLDSPLEIVQTTAQTTPPGDLGAAFVKMILSLTAVVLLLLASYWFLRRLIRNRLEKGVGDAAIQIVEKRMLSPKTMLYLLEIEGKKVLIAESHLEVIPIGIHHSDQREEHFSKN